VSVGDTVNKRGASSEHSLCIHSPGPVFIVISFRKAVIL